MTCPKQLSRQVTELESYKQQSSGIDYSNPSQRIVIDQLCEVIETANSSLEMVIGQLWLDQPLFYRFYYLTNSSICPTPLFVQLQYLTSSTIWPIPLFDQLHFLTNSTIWPVPLFDQLHFFGQLHYLTNSTWTWQELICLQSCIYQVLSIQVQISFRCF